MSHMMHVALAWKLAIFKAFNGWFTVVAMSVIAGITGLEGVNPATAKMIIFILTALVAGNKFIDGFMDQTIQNIKNSNNPLDLTMFDTAHITKTTTEQPTPEQTVTTKAVVDVVKTTAAVPVEQPIEKV